MFIRMFSVFEDLVKVLHKDDKNIYKFVDHCIDELIGKDKIDFGNYSRQEESKKILVECKIHILNFYRNAIERKVCKPDPNLPKIIQEALTTAYDIRKSQIFQALAKENVLKKGHNVVENFDWKVKWVLGSSDFASIRQPILQMDFYCAQKENDSVVSNIINFEMNSETVEEFIQALTAVKKDFESL